MPNNQPKLKIHEGVLEITCTCQTVHEVRKDDDGKLILNTYPPKEAETPSTEETTQKKKSKAWIDEILGSETE